MGTPKNPGTTIMFTLVLISLSLANSLPIQDTEEVAAAKAEFAELFAAAEAGDHAALAPVNNDVQEDQIASAYIEDTEDVAAAKAAFNAAFEEAKSGGLAAKQAAAPVHVVADPVLPTYINVPLRSSLLASIILFYVFLSAGNAICLPLSLKMNAFKKVSFPPTTACPTARTATPLTMLQPQLFIMWRPTMLLQPFHTSPSLPLASMDCPTTDCPTADCPTVGCPLTVEFQPMPTQACPPLPTTPLPLPLQKRRRSRQLARTDFHKCAAIDCRSLLNTD